MYKKIVKNFLYWLTARGKSHQTYKVLFGPAKGVKLNLDLRKEAAYWLGNYDAWILKNLQLEKLIKNGDTVWDCGAYVGFYTGVFRKLVGEKGKVVTIEAVKETFERIKDLPKINGWKNVIMKQCAVGPENSEIQFVSNLNGSNGPFGLAKIYAQDENLEIEKVKCFGVDELIDSGLPIPDVIKFDLESAEVFALMNGEKLFSTKKPILFLELHGKEAFDTTAEFLDKYNYFSKDISKYRDETALTFKCGKELKNAGYIPHMLICWPNAL